MLSQLLDLEFCMTITEVISTIKWQVAFCQNKFSLKDLVDSHILTNLVIVNISLTKGT